MVGAISISDRHTRIVLAGLSAVLLGTTLFSLSVGAVQIPIGDVVLLLLQKLGLFHSSEVDQTFAIVMNSIRIPRIVMTLVIGGALGISGAALQGLFRNPLVEPSIIGVSGGAATGIVLVVVFGASWGLMQPGLFHDLLLPLVAFGAGLTATMAVLRMSKQLEQTNIAILVLMGVAVNALAGAVIGLAIFYADENQLRTFMFWTLGDLGGATVEKLSIAGPLLLIASVLLLRYGCSLNALVLGEAEAFHSGVDVERTKRHIVFLSALAVGVSVSLAGIIGFVGLVIPHLIRTLFYADNRLVLPASMLGGAWLLVISDVVARTIVSPAELPIGVVTALIGSPFFIVLLLRAKNRGEF
ncbi:iron ABC transporter permease [Chryseolinea sp. T2]|uniref:FecCD family ABC transporter permease n=1 Tax=Chryseolinea sp. T2 TaxID=3129255 RepID=UPI00307880FF